MIIVRLRGGLGNQLFQYALGRHLAVLNQTELKLDTTLLHTTNQWSYRKYGLEVFDIQATQATKEEIRQLIGGFGCLTHRIGNLLKRNSYHNEPHFQFDKTALLLQDDTYLDGYWQSERYFLDIAPLIRADITPKLPPSNHFQQTRKMMRDVDSVGVHIRRGDYLSTSKANRYLKPCEATYYQKSIDYIVDRFANPAFFVFSDDISWAKTNIRVPFPTHYMEYNTAQEDLLLMASCQHQIIANSTFSWWGAWLNPKPDKTVIAPQKWFSVGRFNVQDLLPASWIRL